MERKSALCFCVIPRYEKPMRGSSRWEIAGVDREALQPLTASLQISPILAQMLWNRGYRDEVTAGRFLNSQLRDLADPFLLPGMKCAVERTLLALERKERVVLYGDYDVDGITSVAMMKRVLHGLGAEEVQPFLPARFDEGYGLTFAGIERCLNSGITGTKPDLLIILDCGTNSRAEVARLQEQGIAVIVLDHHEPSAPASPVALVNYKLDPSCPHTEYCTAGLVFKFCHALLKLGRQRNSLLAKRAEEIDLRKYLDLVALATIADIAPLTGDNRTLTRYGLRQMAKTQFVGLRALMGVARIGATPTGYDCGFKLGPRLNAAGRLESAMAALQLLLSDNEAEAQQLSKQLDEINRERQSEELRVLNEARIDAEIQLQDPQTRVLVVARPGWHEGVVGIVASRLMREFHLPTFVLALDENKVCKGSGRSLEGFNLAVAVEATKSFLLRGGGHAMAAGVSLEEERLNAWQKMLQIHARFEQGLDGERLKRLVRVDTEVILPQLNLDLMDELQRLEPCGMGNPRPSLMVRGVEIAAKPRMVGINGKHLKLWLRQQGVAVDAIAFGRGSLFPQLQDQSNFLDIVFELERNEYQGNQKIQMNIREMMESAKSESFL